MIGFTQLVQNLIQEGKADQIWTASKLAANPAAVSLIANRLAERGVTQIAPTTMGGNMSLVAELPTRNQVLRIVDVAQENSPVGNPLMLQPDLDFGEINGFRVQVFPKVQLLSEAINDGSISNNDALAKVMKLVDTFASQDQFFWDVRLPNLYVSKNSEVRLLDPGSVCPMSERYNGLIGNDTHTNDDKYQANIAYLCRELGNWTPSIGERIGRRIG